MLSLIRRLFGKPTTPATTTTTTTSSTTVVTDTASGVVCIDQRLASVQVVPVTVETPDMPLPPKDPRAVRVVCISDTHSLHEHVAQIPDGDILVHAGDFSNIGLPGHPTCHSLRTRMYYILLVSVTAAARRCRCYCCHRFHHADCVAVPRSTPLAMVLTMQTAAQTTTPNPVVVDRFSGMAFTSDC
jgi:hypothetical protein